MTDELFDGCMDQKHGRIYWNGAWINIDTLLSVPVENREYRGVDLGVPWEYMYAAFHILCERDKPVPVPARRVDLRGFGGVEL